jgi:ATP:cob(I)alamin adenosyltransferase
VEAYGAMDEAGCSVGLARVVVVDERVADLLRFIQQRLMNSASLTARAASDGPSDRVAVTADDVSALERGIDDLVEASGPWAGFVIEAGSEASARLHVARSVTRRAERRLVTLSSLEEVDPMVLSFINRSSDALYAAARIENIAAGCPEEPWDPLAVPGF